MGFDTYLEIDGRIALMWRKRVSELPRLLFQHDQYSVSTDPTDDSEIAISVAYQSSIKNVLENLDAAGLGWCATISAYAEIRMDHYAEAIFLGMSDAGEESTEDLVRRFETFRAVSPEGDLVALGTLLARQWCDEQTDEVIIFKDITYDGDPPNAASFFFEIIDAARQDGEIDSFAAARAAISIVVLFRDAPLLAWPILVCTLLRHLSTDGEVVYVLTEDAAEEGVTSLEEGHQYISKYWESASSALATTAQTLGRLFSVLASFDNKLSQPFWFARAADLYGRMVALVGDSDSTKKARGDILEQLIDALVRTEEPELRVVEKNFRTREEEIDLVLSNGLSDPFWITQNSPLIMVECKNWKKKPGVQELRVMESKIKDRGAICKIGIFVSFSGFAKTFLNRLKSFQGSGGMIFAVDGDDLWEIINGKTKLTDWLRGKGLLRAFGK
ncbi:restriction endonuclease [Amycolatopsis sp. lyj-23]|uniref:restriction endonuclease n=1 Tax=Amycolatopsis sp. lyj-23 TaxID=2789283 RepID=UPI00397D9447